MTATFLELDDRIGIEPTHIVDPQTGEEIDNPRAGELGPLVRQGLPFPVPEMVDDEVFTQIKVLDIEPAEEISAISLIPARIIPGTRVIETTSDPIAAALLNLEHFHICDPPKTLAKTRGKNAGLDPTTGNIQEA